MQSDGALTSGGYHPRGAPSVGLRTAAVNMVCLLLCINIYGVDPVDYAIILAFILNLSPIVRTVAGLGRSTVALFSGLAFLFCYTLSIFFGGADASFVFNFSLNLGLFLLLASHCNTRVRVTRVVVSLSSGFFVTVLVAAFQTFESLPLLPRQFEVVRDSRFMGMFGDPNLLGAFAVFVFMYWINELVSPTRRRPGRAALSVIFSVTALLVLTFSQSRSAWGGLAIACVAYFYMLSRGSNFRRYAVQIAVACSLVTVAFAILSGTGASEPLERRLLTALERDSDAEDERFGMFYTVVTLGVAASNPFGVGPGKASAATGLTNVDGNPIAAHNAFVQVAAENGWVAGLAFLVLVGLLVFTSMRRAAIGDAPLGISMRVVSSSILAFVFCGVFQDLIQWKFAWVVPAVYVATVISERRRKASPTIAARRSAV